MSYRLLLSALLVLTACDDGNNDTDAGMDGGDIDAGHQTDAGRDAGEVWVGPGCNLVDGIECDGDWTGHCATPCAASECCTPLVSAPSSGEFACIERGADGSCPAANISVDEARIEGQTNVQWQFFAPDDCALVEGCVTTPGWRRLLRFDTWTPNTGTADLYLGQPDDSSPQFEYSDCHMHYHFNGYAQYEVQDDTGAAVATGHKQAFCLLDFYEYPGTGERGLHYTCNNQGIQAGYQDVYDQSLDCQWVDVTDVPPGDYNLHIALNVDHVLLESNYDDNISDIAITIPADAPVDITAACDRPRVSDVRDCAWTRVQVDPYTCTPGSPVVVGCSAACGLGACGGDSVLRACDPTLMDAVVPNDCARMAVLDSNDDAYCNRNDYCSRISFTCPTSGQYVLYTGGYYDDQPTDGCTSVMVDPTP